MEGTTTMLLQTCSRPQGNGLSPEPFIQLEQPLACAFFIAFAYICVHMQRLQDSLRESVSLLRCGSWHQS